MLPLGSLDGEEEGGLPLQVPKEIWLLVDHLFKHACHQVRGELVQRALQSRVLLLAGPWRSPRFSVGRAGLCPCARGGAASPRCSLRLCGEGDSVRDCAAFGRRTCSRLPACRRSWSRSLTAWTPASPRQSVSLLRPTLPGAQLGELPLERAFCHPPLSGSLWGGLAPLCSPEILSPGAACVSGRQSSELLPG